MSRLGRDDLAVRQMAYDQASDLIQRLKSSPPLAAMALNPLLLTMIATPTKKVTNFRNYSSVMYI